MQNDFFVHLGICLLKVYNCHSTKTIESNHPDADFIMSYSVQLLIVVLDLGQKKSVKYLIKSGADVNAKDANGKSVLMWAGQNGDLKIVKTLIDNGADIHVVDVDGKTALMWAEKQ